MASRAGMLLSIAVLSCAAFLDEAGAATFSNPCVFGAAACGGSSGPYHPLGPVLKDSSGNTYGTVAWGGLSSNAGAVFEVTSGGTYVELYDFCARAACADGETPSGNLIMDVNGNLYGTTQTGGKPTTVGDGGGVVYKLSPPVSGTKWTLDVLYKFCWSGNCTGGGNEGSKPVAGLAYAGQASGLPYDGVSTLYGTTQQGGNASSQGVVFSLTPGAGGSWTRKTLHRFCFCGTIPFVDGFQPSTGVVLDAMGNLYGTARGGAQGDGMLYELSPSGSSWTETMLYNFCYGAVGPCVDGRSPDENGIVLDGNGHIWGTTPAGGDFTYRTTDGGGVLYEAYPPSGGCSPSPTWCQRVAHTFCSADAACSDGFAPSAGTGVIIANTSPLTIWGTTSGGGANSEGTLYKYRPAAFNVKHDFCSVASCGDGSLPIGGLYEDTAGSFFGVTEFGGLGFGAVFEYDP